MFERIETDRMLVNEVNPTLVRVEDTRDKDYSRSSSDLSGTPISQEIELVTRYKAVPEHLYCDLNGEAVVLSLANGRYYGMNAVAARIWELVQEPRSVGEIERSILVEYEVEPEVCKRQVSDLLQRMAAEDLLVVVNESGSEIP